MIYIILILTLFFVIALFAFPALSPIPYFPSNKKDLKLIIKTLDLKNDQTIIDLGAGDGLIIFNAASTAIKNKLNTKFIATEINPVLLLILNLRRLFHPNRKNIKVIYADMFKMNYDFLQTTKMYGQDNVLSLLIYLYISPWHMEKTLNNIKKQIKQFNVVSYMYKLPSGTKPDKIVEGVNKVYCYNVIARRNPLANG